VEARQKPHWRQPAPPPLVLTYTQAPNDFQVMQAERLPDFSFQCVRQGVVSMKAGMIALALMTGHASAHDKGCDDNPVPKEIKVYCCGKSDEHRLIPDEITRGSRGEYIVITGGYVFAIPASQALPSADSCSYIFYENSQTAMRHPHYWMSEDKPWTPDVYCFLTPLGF
jgi:hypothetical protein